MIVIRATKLKTPTIHKIGDAENEDCGLRSCERSEIRAFKSHLIAQGDFVIEVSTYLGLFVAGILITISPCILPILPMMLGSGLSKDRLAPAKMGLGLATGFAILGAGLALATSLIGLNTETSRIFFASLIGLAGLILIVPSLSEKFSLLNGVAQKSDQLARKLENAPGGPFWVGILLGGIWSPCIGPLLGAAFSLTASTSTAALASTQMSTFGIGAAVPIIAIAYLLPARLRNSLHKIASHGQMGRKILGLILIVMSLFVISGLDAEVVNLLM